MKNNQLKERMAAFAASVRKKPYAAAIAAAAVVLAAVLFFVMGPPRIFSGIFRDQTGLAMVQEGRENAVQKDEERRQVLRVYTNDATGVINPAYASSAGDRAVSAVIFEPLMRKNVDGKLEPVLARQVRMAGDGATCTIQLKKKCPVQRRAGSDRPGRGIFHCSHVRHGGGGRRPLREYPGRESVSGGSGRTAGWDPGDG